MRRISLAKLLAVIAALAVGFAAVRAGSELWFRGVYALTLVGFAVAVLGAILGTPPKGAWHGFAVFACGYFVLVFVTAVRTTLGAYLPDTGILDGIAARCHQPPSAPTGAPRYASQPPGEFFAYQYFRLTDPGNPTVNAYYQARSAYGQRAHYSQGTCYLLACWTAGLVGSLLGRALARRAADQQ